MTVPNVPVTGLPAPGVAAYLVAWDDAAEKWVPVQASGGSVGAPVASSGVIASVNAATSSTTVLAANANRKGATIYNDSTAVLYLALADTTASTTVYSVQIPAGGYFEVPNRYAGKIVGIWSAANGAARVTEHV